MAEDAMQRWPAHPYPEVIMFRITSSRRASGITTRWFLAPPIAWKRLFVRTQASATARAVVERPTTDTPATSGLARNASATALSPFTRLKTPFGKPERSTKSASVCRVQGTSSDGLTTNVLPVARAYGTNQNGTMAGKLNGAIMANTPIGTRRTSPSMPGATPTSASPCCSTGMPQAVSTFSSVRSTSARASGSDLPFSSVICRAIVSRWSRIIAASLNRGATRRSTGVAAQEGKAAPAAAIAAPPPAAHRRRAEADRRVLLPLRQDADPHPLPAVGTRGPVLHLDPPPEEQPAAAPLLPPPRPDATRAPQKGGPRLARPPREPL